MPELKPAEQRTISGRELIALIREAFAFTDPAFLLLNDIRVPVELVSFEDNDTRDVNKPRSIELLLPPQTLEFFREKKTSYVLEIISKRFKLKIDANALRHETDTIVLQVPESGSVNAIRKNERILIRNSDVVDGVVVSESEVYPCLIRFLDITSGSLGVKIFTDSPIEAASGLTLITHSRGSEVALSGQAKILRLQSVATGKAHFEYIAGVASSAHTSVSNAARAVRHKVVTSLHCLIIASNTSIDLEIGDVSASGFRATKCTPATPWLSEGVRLKELSTGLEFTVVRMETPGSIGARLCSGRIEDRIKWSNFVLPLVSSGRVSANVHDARALVNVFLEAGGTVAESLSYKRHAVVHSRAQSVLTTQTDVFLRWVNVSESGAVLGHQSSYRVGINSWFTGDIVGGQSAQKKIDATFIKNNFRTFREVLKSLKEPQLVFGSWKFGHPYWQEFREFLRSNKHALFLEKYDHVSRSDLSKTASAADFRSLKCTDILDLGAVGIADVIDKFRGTSFEWLLGSLDIGRAGVSFGGLESIYAAGSLPGFRREVCLVQVASIQLLVIFSQLPTGVSVNGVFDTVFVLPFPETQLPQDVELRSLYTSLSCLAASRGFRVGSVRSFLSPEKCIGTETELTIFTNDGMEYFEK